MQLYGRLHGSRQGCSGTTTTRGNLISLFTKSWIRTTNFQYNRTVLWVKVKQVVTYGRINLLSSCLSNLERHPQLVPAEMDGQKEEKKCDALYTDHATCCHQQSLQVQTRNTLETHALVKHSSIRQAGLTEQECLPGNSKSSISQQTQHVSLERSQLCWVFTYSVPRVTAPWSQDHRYETLEELAWQLIIIDQHYKILAWSSMSFWTRRLSQSEAFKPHRCLSSTNK